MNADHLANYSVPDPLRSYEEARRFEHLDLPELDDLALWQERRRIELALAFVPESAGRICLWLAQRLGAIRREQLRRRSLGDG